MAAEVPLAVAVAAARITAVAAGSTVVAEEEGGADLLETYQNARKKAGNSQFLGVCLASITGRHQADCTDLKRFYGTVPSICWS